MIYIGIDPGQKGGIGIIEGDRLVEYFPMPETRKQVYDRLKVYVDREATATIEKVGSMPGQGVASTFKFGKGYGELLGICTALGFRISEPTPQAWKKATLAGTDKSKEASIQRCENLYPDVQLILPRCRNAHDGMAEAILLAHYGKYHGDRNG